MKFIKWTIYSIVSLSFLSVALFANFVLPSYDQTVITGMEVKRMDKDGVITKANPADGPVRDVYFLFTKNPESKKIMVYRNEDTRFDFPFYFKFDTANLQAKAQELINTGKRAEIKYYGWRITYWDEYPNLTNIYEISENDSSRLPLLLYFVYSLLIVGWIFAIILTSRKFK